MARGAGDKAYNPPAPIFLLSRIALDSFRASQKNIRSPKADSSTFEERFLYLASVTFMLPNSTIPPIAYHTRKNKTGTNRIGFVPVILTFI